MLEFYHTFNRGVEKRDIFLEKSDYFRGAHDLYEFNDLKAALNVNRRFNNEFESDRLRKSINKEAREKLVHIITWCLMPNHFHLFAVPIIDKGLSLFHKKFGIGIAKFFNIKHERSGTLFQGRYKKVQVTNDTQALQLICYIHANPLDIWKPNWKEKGLTSSELNGALEFLEKKYRWSSHLDWWGIKNFPSLIDMDFMARFFNNPKEYREFFINWLKYYSKNAESIREFVLD